MANTLATDTEKRIKAKARRVRLSAVKTCQPDIRQPPEGDFLVTEHRAEDGYITWRVRYTGQSSVTAAGLAVVTTVAEAREAITAHRASGGATWHSHLVG